MKLTGGGALLRSNHESILDRSRDINHRLPIVVSNALVPHFKFQQYTAFSVIVIIIIIIYYYSKNIIKVSLTRNNFKNTVHQSSLQNKKTGTAQIQYS